MSKKFPGSGNYFDYHENNSPDINVAVLGIIYLGDRQRTVNKGGPYDVVWRSSSDTITSREHVMHCNYGDGCFGIVVHNCTYAILKYNGEHITLIKDENNYFVLPYTVCSYDKPIINLSNINDTILYTDGNYMTYNIIVINMPYRRQIYMSINNINN